MKPSRVSRSQAGRPARGDGDQVRDTLLDAARGHFLKREFKAVSVREIAEAAGVNAAMVNYYFGGKQGLYEAMVDELLNSLDHSLREVEQQEQLSVAEFSASYSRLLAANPWWPNFIVREVLFGQGAIRERVLDRFTSHFAPRLMRSLEKEIGAGYFRQDLDPRMTMLSLMGITIFPFLARPIVESALQLPLNADTVEEVAAHNTDLFLHGVLAPSRREPK